MYIPCGDHTVAGTREHTCMLLTMYNVAIYVYAHIYTQQLVWPNGIDTALSHHSLHYMKAAHIIILHTMHAYRQAGTL